ncbi:MAG: anhydro-N-acetylmuramic acid kinase [Verrucomicrobia bacterium]|nr:MAG: anhydro-N-acetylmuramic acid kinase [Verrucomicrobiota bacterium]
MSGTSADGIDAVVARITGQGRRTKAHVQADVHKAFPAALRQRILRTALHGTVAEVCELNFVLGEQFASAALAVIRRAGLKPENITAIGSHGQTIHHLPNAATPATLQIGEPAIIAERTGITAVADFRVADMAAGGQGAPLVPFADWALFTHDTRPRIVQNIGGIGNLTFLPPRATLDQVIALDTGPGNMVLDAIVSKLSSGQQAFDRNGRWATQGKVSEKLLTQLMSHPFVRRNPPKTTGREEFGEPFVRLLLLQAQRLHVRGADLVATTTAFTAATIADAYHRFIFPKIPRQQHHNLQIVLGGGGAKNATLIRMLRERIGAGEILTHEDLGISNAAKEALAFAILARETLLGRPSNVPAATGARRPVVLGKIIPAAHRSAAFMPLHRPTLQRRGVSKTTDSSNR